MQTGAVRQRWGVMNQPLPAAVLWDMDGTLVDTEPYWIAVEYQIVDEFGDGSWDDGKARDLIGRELRDSARRMQRNGGVRLEVDDIVERLLDGVIDRVRLKIPWRPGARRLLNDLHEAGIPCALVTMSWRRFVDQVLAALPAGVFDVVITGDEVTDGKPNPQPYQLAARGLGVTPQECVAIEDSPTGLQSAVAAGCKTLAIPNSVDIASSDDYTLAKSLRQVDLGLLQSMFAVDRSQHRRRSALLGSVGLVAFVAVAAALAWRNADPPPPPPPDIPIVAWAPYWTADEATASLSTNGSQISELSPFWYTAATAASITMPAPDELSAGQQKALLAAARRSGSRLTPSIVDGMGKGAMAAVVADPVARAQHVAAIVQLVRSRGFSGIDIDYEGFAFVDGRDTWATTRRGWVAFVSELADRLHAIGKTLSVTIPPVYDTGQTTDSGYWVYDPAGIGPKVDELRVMAYDFNVDKPGPIAPLEFVQRTIAGAKATVRDNSKIILGVPLYGRNWVVATTGTCPSTAEGTTTVLQRNIDELLATRGATPVSDPFTGESSFSYVLQVTDGATTCTQTRQVFYVDAAGARRRVDLARTSHLAGAALWALGFDSPATWTEIGDLPRKGAPGATTVTSFTAG